MDIYGYNSELQNSFKEFAGNLEKDGVLFKNFNLPINGVDYGFNSKAEYSIINYRIENDSSCFDIKY